MIGGVISGFNQLHKLQQGRVNGKDKDGVKDGGPGRPSLMINSPIQSFCKVNLI